MTLPLRGWAALLIALSVLFAVALLLSRLSFTPVPDIPSPQERITQARRAGRPLQALYHVESLAGESGWTGDLLRQAGDLWRDAGDLARAMMYWEAAAQLDPADPVLARGLAEAYLTAQRWTDAVSALDRLLALNDLDYWAHLQLGLLRAPFDAQTAGEHLRAASAEPAYRDLTARLLAILDDNPSDPLLTMRLGTALVDEELWDYAELSFRQAAVVNAPYAEALASIALARDAQGKDGGAWIREAVELEPDSPQVRYLEGLHFRRLGDDAASIAALTHAVQLAPENPALNAELGTAYRLAGDPAEAERWLRLAVLFSNGDPHFQALLDTFYAEESALVEAFEGAESND